MNKLLYIVILTLIMKSLHGMGGVDKNQFILINKTDDNIYWALNSAFTPGMGKTGLPNPATFPKNVIKPNAYFAMKDLPSNASTFVFLLSTSAAGEPPIFLTSFCNKGKKRVFLKIIDGQNGEPVVQPLTHTKLTAADSVCGSLGQSNAYDDNEIIVPNSKKPGVCLDLKDNIAVGTLTTGLKITAQKAGNITLDDVDRIASKRPWYTTNCS